MRLVSEIRERNNHPGLRDVMRVWHKEKEKGDLYEAKEIFR